MWRLTKPDSIDQVIDQVLADPGLINWRQIRKDLAAISIQIDRSALHRRVKKRLYLIIQKKHEK